MNVLLQLLRGGWPVVIAAALLFLSQPALTQAFFQAIEDLPVAPGLMEAADEGVSFDSPRGRIATVVAFGTGDKATYSGFYAKALPALGWKRLSENNYRRDGEAMSLEFKWRGSRTEVRIRVVPAGSEKAR